MESNSGPFLIRSLFDLRAHLRSHNSNRLWHVWLFKYYPLDATHDFCNYYLTEPGCLILTKYSSLLRPWQWVGLLNILSNFWLYLKSSLVDLSFQFFERRFHCLQIIQISHLLYLPNTLILGWIRFQYTNCSVNLPRRICRVIFGQSDYQRISKKVILAT